MNELGSFVTSVKNLEKQLSRVIISSWLFSLIPLVIQNRLFDVSFNVIVTVVAGITGTAAILSVYLGNLKHVTDLRSEILNYHPVFKGFTSSLSLLLSAGLFYAYYFYAKQSNELCLLFFGLGTFIFFRTLSGAASTMLTIEQQRIIWQNMSQEERVTWLENKQKMEETLQSVQKLSFSDDSEVDEIKNKVKQIKKQHRERKWKAFRDRIWQKSKGIRKKVGLYTFDDQIEDIEDQRLLANIMKMWAPDFHLENIRKIEKGEVHSLLLEPEMIEYFEIDNEFRYVFINDMFDTKKATWYIENLSGLQESGRLRFEFVVAVLPEDIKATKEGVDALEAAGIHVFHYKKSNEKSSPKST